MITIHICSKNDSTVITKTIDPKSKDEFDRNMSDIITFGINQLGRFYLDFDTFDSTPKQIEWVEEEN